jgi:hypothetical protein
MAYDLEAMLVRVTGWNDDLNAGFATMREMKVMTVSGRRWLHLLQRKSPRLTIGTLLPYDDERGQMRGKLARGCRFQSCFFRNNNALCRLCMKER